MYKLQSDAFTTFYLSVMDNLRQIVKVPLRLFIGVPIKKAIRRTELPLCEYAKICWSMPKELISQINKKMVEIICVSFFFILIIRWPAETVNCQQLLNHHC